MQYTVEVAGISFNNSDGTPRRELVIDYLSGDLKKVSVSLKRHSGNRSDKNAVGVYIEVSGWAGIGESMIGFLPREVAKDVSPMLKSGSQVSEIQIKRVWIPDFSSTATPCVTISFYASWSRDDVINLHRAISEQRKAKRIENKSSVKQSDNIKPAHRISFFRKLIALLFSPKI